MANRHNNQAPGKNAKVVAETRRYQMLELTKAGASERQIAETLGVSRGLVHREVKRVLSDLAKSHGRTANVVRSLQMERYLSLLSRWWQQALAGDETASNMVLRIMSRIDIINGIIPDKPLIDMRTQTLQIGEGMGLMELAKVVANGSGQFGIDGVGSDDPEQSSNVPSTRPGGKPISEAD